MKQYLKYVIASIVLFSLDALWIFVNLGMYSASVKAIQKTELVVNYYYAILAYVFVLFSTLWISIPFTQLHIEDEDNTLSKLVKSFLYGGTVGLAVNGVYNFTCLAIYTNYDLSIAVIDTIWGTILNTVVVFVYVAVLS